MSVLNLGSYNYLGFADDWNETCKDEVFRAMEKFDCNMASSRADAGPYPSARKAVLVRQRHTRSPLPPGTTSVHKDLERTVAKFVGKEDAIVFNMGYGTNSTTVPALMGKGSLIISDSLNHTSIVNGARASGARIKVFNHNGAAAAGCQKRSTPARTLTPAPACPQTRRTWRSFCARPSWRASHAPTGPGPRSWS